MLKSVAARPPHNEPSANSKPLKRKMKGFEQGHGWPCTKNANVTAIAC